MQAQQFPWLVAKKLRTLGYGADLTPPSAPYDIEVVTNENRYRRIEVKTSALRSDASGEYFKFYFAQPLSRRAKGRHKRGTKVAKPTSHYDAAVLVAIDTDSIYYFVLPASALRGKNSVRINQSTKNGKYLKYLNAFHNIT